MDKVDFLNQWEVYQKLSYLVNNQKMQIKSVDTSNLLELIDFVKPGLNIFENKHIAKDIQ